MSFFLFIDDIGIFWFFEFNNFEIFVKVFDGCNVNGYYWVFIVGLIDVEVEIDIIDFEMS